jgi:DDE superfamily endonuclease
MIAALDLATGKMIYRIRARKRRREFPAFLKLLRQRRPGQKLYLIADNFAPHKYPDVTTWAAASDAEPVYLPANSSCPCCDLGRWDAAECDCGHGHVGGQRLRCAVSRQTGKEASPDHGDSRDRSTAEPISRGQPCMRWFRPAFAIALDCAVTRAGDSAWADRPGLPHRLADVLVQRRPQRGHGRPFELAVVCAGRNVAQGASYSSRRSVSGFGEGLAGVMAGLGGGLVVAAAVDGPGGHVGDASVGLDDQGVEEAA